MCDLKSTFLKINVHNNIINIFNNEYFKKRPSIGTCHNWFLFFYKHVPTYDLHPSMYICVHPYVYNRC
jgi:hypothetical protein